VREAGPWDGDEGGAAAPLARRDPRARDPASARAEPRAVPPDSRSCYSAGESAGRERKRVAQSWKGPPSS